jgi:3-oxoacyl-[acyl-carrier protein] reductase
MAELTDTVAIVTGAAQGIGERTARTLAKDGATLLLADIQEEKLAGVADSIRREQGTRVESVYVDIAKPLLCEKMVEEALRYFGRVDGLVNVGGIDAPPRKAWEIDENHWRELIEVDLNGPFWCIKAVMPHMMQRRKGRIVTISSITGRAGSLRYSPAYAAAKAGLIGMTIGLAVQLEEYGILVNAIAPGATGTTGTPTTPEEHDEYIRTMPLGFGGPQPVADAVLYLLRSSGDWVSGAVMNVSGGGWRGP